MFLFTLLDRTSKVKIRSVNYIVLSKRVFFQHLFDMKIMFFTYQQLKTTDFRNSKTLHKCNVIIYKVNILELPSLTTPLVLNIISFKRYFLEIKIDLF